MFIAVLAMLISTIALGADAIQVVPLQVVTAKAILPFVYYPDGAAPDVNEVRWEADQFLTKWHRYEVTYDLATADIIAFIAVEPITTYPGFWQRVSWGMATSQAGEHCTAQSYGTTATADCYTVQPPPALTPGIILRGSILIFDGYDFKQWASEVVHQHSVTTGRRESLMIAMRDDSIPLPHPIMSALANGRGSRPLIGAGKKLRKMIDEATKKAGSK